MRVLCADLHIHTCLSPCAEREMSPSAVVGRARERGLDLIAVCDHNSAENVEAASLAGARVGLAVIGGMEIASREEVHVLGLFGESRQLRAVQEIVYDHLPGENDPEAFGEQLVLDGQDNVMRRNRRLLIGATSLTLDRVVRTIHEFDGLAVASHVDRPSFSVLGQLGFIPGELELDGVEVCSGSPPALPEGLGVVFSSDAHRLAEIGERRTCFLVEEGTATEVGMVLRRARGRRIVQQ